MYNVERLSLKMSDDGKTLSIITNNFDTITHGNCRKYNHILDNRKTLDYYIYNNRISIYEKINNSHSINNENVIVCEDLRSQPAQSVRSDYTLRAPLEDRFFSAIRDTPPPLSEDRLYSDIRDPRQPPSEDRFFSAIRDTRQPPSSSSQPARPVDSWTSSSGPLFITETAVGGASTVAEKYARNFKVGIMVAANSGKPGGGCSDGKKVKNINAYNKGQEEDIVSNWLLTAHPKNPNKQWELFKRIKDEWGLLWTGNMTKQLVDYVNTVRAEDYRKPCFFLADQQLSPKIYEGKVKKFDHTRKYTASLVFVAGPNVSEGRTFDGSMTRTRNRKCMDDYNFFKECIANALYAGLVEMFNNRIQIALVARLSTGIYADYTDKKGKNYKISINSDFDEILNNVLQQLKTQGVNFIRVIVPLLSHEETSRVMIAKPSESCRYGSNCYRKNPEHIFKYHARHRVTNSIQCRYGNDCYRQNPAHIRKYHQPGWRPKNFPSQRTGVCKYRNDCYRKNPDHIRMFHHNRMTIPKKPDCMFQGECYHKNPNHINFYLHPIDWDPSQKVDTDNSSSDSAYSTDTESEQEVHDWS